MFSIEMLPAAHGDCLWVEYGDANIHRILIDGGPSTTYQALFDRVSELPCGERVFELFVITHIDADHIEGSIRLLRDAINLGCEFKRIWFNGFEELSDDAQIPADLGAEQGEFLSLVISDYESEKGERHNVEFADTVRLDDLGNPVLVPGFADGLEVTVLSPSVAELTALKFNWKKTLTKAGIGPAGPSALRFRGRLEANSRLRPLSTPDAAPLGAVPEDPTLGDDDSIANGSSIGLLLEHRDGSALVVGDAFASVLETSIKLLVADRPGDRLVVDHFKLPHHGSSANVSAELLQLISAKNYLISTSGATFGHPSPPTIDALLHYHDSTRGPPEIVFNYRSPSTAPWATRAERRSAANDDEPKYIARYEPGVYWWSGDPKR